MEPDIGCARLMTADPGQGVGKVIKLPDRVVDKLFLKAYGWLCRRCASGCQSLLGWQTKPTEIADHYLAFQGMPLTSRGNRLADKAGLQLLRILNIEISADAIN